MTEKGQESIKGNRLYFLDNLRTFIIFLVIFYHAGGIYESSGIWGTFWLVDDSSTNELNGIVNIFMDLLVMPTMFLISGYFVPRSLESKTASEFVVSKLKRLLIPWAIAVFTLVPLYKFIFLYSRGLPQEQWINYLYFNTPNSQVWMWYLTALFLFNMLFLALTKLNVDLSKISIKAALWGVFIIGFIYSAIFDIFGGHGWTLTFLLDFQNERLLIYFLFFLLGTVCYYQKIFESKWKNTTLSYIFHGTAWLPLNIYTWTLILIFVTPDKHIVSATFELLLLHFSYLISVLYMVYGVLYLFRNYFNKQGPVTKELNRNSYGVYILHVIVLGFIALTMLNASMPSLVKFLIVVVSTFVGCNLLVSIYRKLIQVIFKTR